MTDNLHNADRNLAADRNAAVETLILATAARHHFVKITFPDGSTFVPYAGVVMQILHNMDKTMAYTRHWTDNCMGWVPPYSLIHISMLFYIQTIRAMEAAGAISCSSELQPILSMVTFHFPLEKLPIPGPLVQFFKNLACFLPSPDGSFGSVTPALPNKPGWRRKRNRYALPDPFFTHLPNIQAIISRLHTICATAHSPGMTDRLFSSHVDGPACCATLFNRVNDGTEDYIMASPGMTNVMAGGLRLWLAASGLPPALDCNVDSVHDDWRTFLSVDSLNKWFPPIVCMMSKYCQFWKGSSDLAECAPSCSAAAGSVTCQALESNDLAASPEWCVGHADRIGHYVLSRGRNATFNATCPLRKLPHVTLWAAATYAVNMLIDSTDKPKLQTGKFWDIRPNALVAEGVHTLPGILASIIRDYHSDSHLD